MQLKKQSHRLIWGTLESIINLKINVHQIIPILLGQSHVLFCNSTYKYKDIESVIYCDSPRDCPIFLWLDVILEEELSKKKEIAKAYAKNVTEKETNNLTNMMRTRFKDAFMEYDQDVDQSVKNVKKLISQLKGQQISKSKYVEEMLMECVLNEKYMDTLFVICRNLEIIESDEYEENVCYCNGLLSPKMITIQQELDVLNETKQELKAKNCDIIFIDDKMFVPHINFVHKAHSNCDVKWLELFPPSQAKQDVEWSFVTDVHNKDNQLIGSIYEDADETTFMVMDWEETFFNINLMAQSILSDTDFNSWADFTFGNGFFSGYMARDNCNHIHILKQAHKDLKRQTIGYYERCVEKDGEIQRLKQQIESLKRQTQNSSSNNESSD